MFRPGPPSSESSCVREPNVKGVFSTCHTRPTTKSISKVLNSKILGVPAGAAFTLYIRGTHDSITPRWPQRHRD